ncbi:MAG: hypothetical protein HY319_09620 [Armatimonadetes bacterium]|nr:hypothetical protein [Armatimonadota bacterium]
MALEELVQGRRPAAITTRQFADCIGRVRNLALMLSDYVDGEAREQVLNAYKVLFTEMEPDTRFTVVVDDDRDRQDVERIIVENHVPNPERIRLLQPGANGLTVWMRDVMVPQWMPDNPQHTAILAQKPLHDWHGNDKKIPPLIAQEDPSILLNKDSRVCTDGGDVMSNSRESFVGYYSLSATADRLHALCQDPQLKTRAVDFFEASSGREVVPDGAHSSLPYLVMEHPSYLEIRDNPNYEAPHLAPAQASEGEMYEELARELFQSELGKPVTVMGKDDPETEHREEPATDHMDMGMTPISDRTFLVGDPALTARLIREMSPEDRRLAEEKLGPVEGILNQDNQEDFEAYVKTLEQSGYRVVRVPHADRSGWYSYLSYNNCLMERFEREDGQQVQRVFLPVYGIPGLDRYATEVWESQGFEVHPLPFDKVSRMKGALRCISNWLDRSPRA